VGTKIFLRFRQLRILVSDEIEPMGLLGGLKHSEEVTKITLKGKEALGL
jgi:hypothetical protein